MNGLILSFQQLSPDLGVMKLYTPQKILLLSLRSPSSRRSQREFLEPNDLPQIAPLTLYQWEIEPCSKNALEQTRLLTILNQTHSEGEKSLGGKMQRQLKDQFALQLEQELWYHAKRAQLLKSYWRFQEASASTQIKCHLLRLLHLLPVGSLKQVFLIDEQSLWGFLLKTLDFLEKAPQLVASREVKELQWLFLCNFAIKYACALGLIAFASSMEKSEEEQVDQAQVEKEALMRVQLELGWSQEQALLAQFLSKNRSVSALMALQERGEKLKNKGLLFAFLDRCERLGLYKQLYKRLERYLQQALH